MENFEEVLTEYGIRMHKKQKKAFREYLTEKAKEMNYKSTIEKNLISKNFVVGDIDNAEIIFTAHYDTPPRLPASFVKHMMFNSFVTIPLIFTGLIALPNIVSHITNSYNAIMTAYHFSLATEIGGSALACLHLMGFLGNANKTNYNDNSSGCLALLHTMQKYKDLPEEQKKKIAFVFFDNEEKFLLGSSSFKYKHRKTYKNKTFVNMDCVGLGKQMNLYHFGNATQISKDFEKILGENNIFTPSIKKGSITSMSDHYPFRKANHVCLLSVDEKNNNSIYSQIHSSNDNNIDWTNISGVVETISKLPIIQSIEQTGKTKIKTKDKIIKLSQDNVKVITNTTPTNSKENTKIDSKVAYKNNIQKPSKVHKDSINEM